MDKKIKKVLIRLLCIFIPSKIFRSYIRLGITNRFFYAKKLMRKKYEFADEVVIIAMIRNEADYLDEWINYHRLIGVTKFYLYDNESTDNTYTVLKKYIDSGLVEYEYLTDKKIEELKPKYKESTKSHVAHWLAIEKCRANAKWVAIIDIDEFIVPKLDNNLIAFLSRFNDDVSQIILGWTVFGSSGNISKLSGLVIENYTMRGQGHRGLDDINNFKSIVNPRAIIMDCNHYHHIVGKTVNETGASENIWENADKIVPTDICTINHYVVKSYNECKRKIINNHNIYAARYDETYFKKFDANDVQDKSISKFISVLKKIMEN